MAGKIAKGAGLIRQGDVAGIISLALNSLDLFGVSVRLEYVYVRDPGSPRPAIPGDPPVSVSAGTRDDIGPLARLTVGEEKKRAIFGTRLEAGNIVYVSRCGGDRAGYAWISADGVIHPPERIMRFVPPGALFWYDVFVLPECRRRGAFRALLGRVIDDHAGRAIACHVSCFNVAAQRAHESQHFSRKSLVLSISLFRIVGFALRIRRYD